jgi:hypothetical protein
LVLVLVIIMVLGLVLAMANKPIGCLPDSFNLFY